MPMLTILFSLILSTPSFALAEGTGLKFSAAGDLVGSFDSKNQTRNPRKFEAREAEIGVYGPIDHGFDGAIFFAAHPEGGEMNLELHEAYLATSKLIPNTRLKAGKFFLGVGRLNQLHRHDWPFIRAPKAHEAFFAEEAAVDTGAQANVLLPFLPVFTELGLGVTSGWTYGHSHSAGSKPVQPTHYARLQNYFPLGETGGLQTGLNYLGRTSRTDGKMMLYGIDFVAKWREGGVVKWLLQGEAYGRHLRLPSASLEKTLGGYFYAQRNLKGPVDLGLRLDAYTVDTSPVKNLDYSIVPNLVYRHSEFARFSASYQWDFEQREHKNSQVDHVLQAQLVFLLGDHPSHDF